MKKILKKLMTLLLIGVVTMCNVTQSLAATNVYTGTEEWTTGFLNKQYWRQENYRDNTNVYVIITLKYISKSLKWNKLGTNQTLTVEEGKTVGAATSLGVAKSLGLEVVPEGCGVTTSNTYEVTNSFTTNRSHTEAYTVTFTKEDKVGFYTWEARINAHEYTTYLYWRPNKKSGWSYQGKGKAFSFTSKNPYIELGYTTFAVN